jgi:hypothetical protein
MVRILLRKMKCYNCSKFIETNESIILSTLRNRATTNPISIDSAMNNTIMNNNHLLSGNSVNLSNETVCLRRFGSDFDILTIFAIIALMFIFCTFSICASLENCIPSKKVFIRKRKFISFLN